MSYIADLHLHSRFSRACSKEITIPNLAKWAKKKGIDLLGTGDFLHPLWQQEMKVNLQERGDGILEHDGVKFLLTCELSCIYSDQGKTRRIHLLLFLPSLASVQKLGAKLSQHGVKLGSDGRPIMGMSAYELTRLVFNVEPKAVMIPCHIWTPWFSLFGSMSGYDFLEECFQDLSNNILAVETGLSSDPAMNWQVASLDSKTVVSFSDAHSVPNLGREATIFAGNLSFDELRNDLIKQNLVGTIEFFPEEGKYHYSGHRECGVVYNGEDLAQKGSICPVCAKPLVLGVTKRVEDLATRSLTDLKLSRIDSVVESQTLPGRPGYQMLVGLEKIIAESLGCGVASRKVKNEYDKLIQNLGSELKILREISLDTIDGIALPKVAEGIGRVREGKLIIEPGYDGVYGEVRIWGEDEIKGRRGQQSLF